MANTIAKCVGIDKSGRRKVAHRLGSDAAVVEANTWRTFARVVTCADGQVFVEIKRDNKRLLYRSFGPELPVQCATCKRKMHRVTQVGENWLCLKCAG